MIRLGVPADAAEVARVFVQAWRGGYRGLVDDRIIDGLDATVWSLNFARRLADDALTTIVWPAEDCLLGFAISRVDQQFSNVGYLASLYVDPAASGRGIGSALLAEVLQAFRRDGLTTGSLWVFSANHRARRLYERWGFAATDQTTVDPQWGVEQARYQRALR